ncbi:MAG: hypothetical protein IPJ61_07535 [Tessaracoccus sp.]|uniref:hypothetical protein n=1 Tax=Tessaracoccus sp. TaxID=1971211 RepID=UPI001EBBEB90|nr:hypothetical protein [Tessaracoccus sp.]MBK7820924.1 hypothetical protein [Tessaracoccus sp.]
MPDRIPQLDDLATAAKETPMLSPAEIRRRGDRRRATRHTTSAIAAVLALTVGGVTVWNSPLLDNIRTPQWAAPGPTTPTTQTPLNPLTSPSQPADPTGSPVAPAVIPPTWANLPTAEIFNARQQAPWVSLVGEFEGEGESGRGYCDPGRIYGTPSTELVRVFGSPEAEISESIWATVLGYPSVERAEQAFATLRDGVANCPERIEQIGKYPNPKGYDNTADLPFDPEWAGGAPTDHAFLTSVGMDPPGEFGGLFSDTLLVRAGDRVLWVTQDVYGPDHNCSIAPDDEHIPEQCLIPAAMQETVETLVK